MDHRILFYRMIHDDDDKMAIRKRNLFEVINRVSSVVGLLENSPAEKPSQEQYLNEIEII